MTLNSNSPDLARQILAHFQNKQTDIESFIRRLVETESPSGDSDGSVAVVEQIANVAGRLRCVDSVERIKVSGFGEHLVIKAFQQASDEQILLVGHTDTVHDRGSVQQRPWRVDDGKAYGPGVFDMKANCALAVEVLRTLDTLHVSPQVGVTVVLTCDEEVGSFSGWPLLQSVATSRPTPWALVLEPPAPGGRVKTGRKGTGMFSIKVEGKAAHAGLEPEKGASAILELARQTQLLHSINRPGSGITINVGVVHGGTRSNVVAAEAEAEIDVRFSTEAESREVEQLLSNLKPIDDRTKVFVTGAINRPPLERTASVIELYERARVVGSWCDYELGEAQVGGASDGNFLASMGVTVLDGLGIKGDGAHAVHEHIEVDDIPRRGALIAGLIAFGVR
jgi:glutamate carboxypeptidase